MILHEYKFIFIYMPKCAEASIEKALGHLENHNGRGGHNHRSIRVIEQPLLLQYIFSSKENISEILLRACYKYRAETNPRNKLTVIQEQYNSYYKLTFIRNP